MILNRLLGLAWEGTSYSVVVEALGWGKRGGKKTKKVTSIPAARTPASQKQLQITQAAKEVPFTSSLLQNVRKRQNVSTVVAKGEWKKASIHIYFFTSRVTSLHPFNVEHEYVSTEEKLASIAGSAAQQKAVAAQE